MTRKISHGLCFTTLLFFLISCASTNSNIVSKETEFKSTRGAIEGIWTGEFDIADRGPYDFTSVHFDGKAYAYSLQAKAMCIGTAKYDGENFISRYVLFALDGGPFDLATITGKLVEENKIASHFVTSNGGDTGALNVSYNPIYDLSSSLVSSAGEWSYTDRDDLTTDFNIAEDGTIIGNDSDSCEYLGYLDIVNPNFNLYQVKVEASACGSVNGEYEGVAFLDGDELKVQIANEKYSLFFGFFNKN